MARAGVSGGFPIVPCLLFGEDAGVDVARGPDLLQLHVAAGVRRVPPEVVAGVDADVWLVATLPGENQVAPPQLPRPDVVQRAVLRVGVLRQPDADRVPVDPLHVAGAVERVRSGSSPDV